MTRQPDPYDRRAGWRLVCPSIRAGVLLLALYALAPASPAARLGHATAMASQSACTQAAATVSLRLDGALAIAGQAPLDYVEFSMRWPSGDSCTATVNSFRSSTATVSSLTYDVVERTDGREITGIELVFDPGATTESVTAQCGRSINNHTEPYYSGYFGLLHADERTASGFRIGAWTHVGGPVLARKTYGRTITPAESPLPLIEQTTFELRHTPVR